MKVPKHIVTRCGLTATLECGPENHKFSDTVLLTYVAEDGYRFTLSWPEMKTYKSGAKHALDSTTMPDPDGWVRYTRAIAVLRNVGCDWKVLFSGDIQFTLPSGDKREVSLLNYRIHRESVIDILREVRAQRATLRS